MVSSLRQVTLCHVAYNHVIFVKLLQAQFGSRIICEFTDTNSRIIWGYLIQLIFSMFDVITHFRIQLPADIMKTIESRRYSMTGCIQCRP